MNQTAFTSKCNILSELWMDYRQDDQFKDFIEYNDMGLPLAYFLSQGIVEKTDISVNFINETFDILLAALNIEDSGFETLDEVLDKQ
jgi:hypothetical protein